MDLHNSCIAPDKARKARLCLALGIIGQRGRGVCMIPRGSCACQGLLAAPLLLSVYRAILNESLLCLRLSAWNLRAEIPAVSTGCAMPLKWLSSPECVALKMTKLVGTVVMLSRVLDNPKQFPVADWPKPHCGFELAAVLGVLPRRRKRLLTAVTICRQPCWCQQIGESLLLRCSLSLPGHSAAQLCRARPLVGTRNFRVKRFSASIRRHAHVASAGLVPDSAPANACQLAQLLAATLG